jgi:hypothetical protein
VYTTIVLGVNCVFGGRYIVIRMSSARAIAVAYHDIIQYAEGVIKTEKLYGKKNV